MSVSLAALTPRRDCRQGGWRVSGYLRLALLVGLKGGAVLLEHAAQLGVHGTEAGLGKRLVEDDVDDLPQNFHVRGPGLEQIHHLLTERPELVTRNLVEDAAAPHESRPHLVSHTAHELKRERERIPSHSCGDERMAYLRTLP